MTAKERMNRSRNLGVEIHKKRERLMRMRAIAEKSTASYGETGRGGVADKQKIIAQIVDMERELEADELALIGRQLMVQREIDQLHDSKLRTIMAMRYIDMLPWDRIAREVHYSRRWVMALRNLALEELDA